MDALRDDQEYARTHYAVDMMDGNVYYLDGKIKEYRGGNAVAPEASIPAAARTAWRRRVAAHCRRVVTARVLRAQNWAEWAADANWAEWEEMRERRAATAAAAAAASAPPTIVPAGSP